MYIQANENGHKVATGTNWRLVHDGISVMDLAQQDFESTAGGSTEIFVVATKAECDAEIARLNLVVPEFIAERYN